MSASILIAKQKVRLTDGQVTVVSDQTRTESPADDCHES